jgi:hypothetical protein
VIVQGGRIDQLRSEDEILADVQRELAAQGAPDDVLTGRRRVIVDVIVAPVPAEPLEETVGQARGGPRAVR